MKNPIRLIWQCEKCEDVVISYSNLKHDINYCSCGETAVDLEEYYQKDIGKIKELSRKKKVGDKWQNI